MFLVWHEKLQKTHTSVVQSIPQVQTALNLLSEKRNSLVRLFIKMFCVTVIVRERDLLLHRKLETKSVSPDVTSKPAAWKSHLRTGKVNGYHAVREEEL